MSPSAAAALMVVFTDGSVESARATVTVSWLSPVSTISCWPARTPTGTCRRRPVAPMACAPLSVVRASALSACMLMTVPRSSNEVVTTNVLTYLDVLPAVSWSEAVCVCLPTVSLKRSTVLGTMNSPSSVMRRIAAPPAPLETVSVASRKRGSVRSGVSVCDWRILPSTICGT